MNKEVGCCFATLTNLLKKIVRPSHFEKNIYDFNIRNFSSLRNGFYDFIIKRS